MKSDRPAAAGIPESPGDPHARTEPPPDLESAATSERETEKALSVAREPQKDLATLTVLTGFNSGQMFALDKPEIFLGRGTDADIWAEDPAVSRKHARIVKREGGRFVLDDLGSTNGTFVGGRRVDHAELSSGDRLQLGPTLIMRFAYLDEAEREMQQRLYESSTRDALTRAFNRKYLGERLVAEVAHARRHRSELSLLMLDLDDFKETNDAYGHLVGDMVLRVVAARLARLIRVEDVLARYGGEEFVIVARDTSAEQAEALAERTRLEIERLVVRAKEAELHVTASIGVAALSELSTDAGAQELVALADVRLYRAKSAGRNRVCVES
jgi:diguanylate cyclase (GGDEF)-like protein